MRRNLGISAKMEQVAQILKFYERDRGELGDKVTEEKSLAALTIARDILSGAVISTEQAIKKAATEQLTNHNP